ncbi:hypothetical protein C8R45DRAFT_816833 [Mycena sanguinolenta]|nr:hypothetical protein C8R45DRAFT_816833 [Mycena sanguinolenta]
MKLYHWNPCSAAGCPTADDVYQGYFIPKGSIVMGNSWGILILHSEHYGADTDIFRAERFLSPHGKRGLAAPAPEAAFGYGGCICPGRENLWIMMASILSAFDVKKAVDESGSIIKPSCEYSTSLIWWVNNIKILVLIPSLNSNPLLFECIMELRSASTRELVVDSLHDDE